MQKMKSCRKFRPEWFRQKLAGQAGAVEGEAVEGAKSSYGDLLGRKNSRAIDWISSRVTVSMPARISSSE